jgi:nicotinamide mononucleotide transporter
VWLVVDVLYVGLYVYKDLHVTAVLYAVFVVLAARGPARVEQCGLGRWRR